MTLADIGTQTLVEKSQRDARVNDKTTSKLDWQRTGRWTMAGLLLHGPYFFTGFTILDRRFGPATSLRNVALKTATAQFFLFPPYLVALFGFMGLMEGQSDVIEKIEKRVPEAFLSGCVFWPVVNSVNFSVVSSTMRVPYLAACAGVWNSYLSWTNAR